MTAIALPLALMLLTAAPVAAAQPSATAVESPSFFGPSHRKAYLVSAALFASGVAMGYWASSEADRITGIDDVRAYRREAANVRGYAATSNMLYALAGAALVYGLALEFLPPPLAERASLTFHF